MEFSYNYDINMRRLSVGIHNFDLANTIGTKDAATYSAMLQFTISGDTFEVPSSMDTSEITNLLRDANGQDFKIVIPLYTSQSGRTISGAEAMLKYFTRAYYNARVYKVITPKNEVYYGREGLILDSNFDPLMIITKTILRDTRTNGVQVTGYTVHMHPSVFLEDTKVLNKSLAKKGMAYYLSNSVCLPAFPPIDVPYKVVIDDCSEFLKHPTKPEKASFSKETINGLLKQHIDEILLQVTHDSRNCY